MLEFTGLGDIVEAFNKGELKKGDIYIHRGKERVLRDVDGRTISSNDVGAPPFRGSQAEKEVAKILLRGALMD